MKRNKIFQFKNEWFLILLPLFIALNGFVRYPQSIQLGELTVFILINIITISLLVFVFQFLMTFRKATLFIFFILLFNALYGLLIDNLKVILTVEEIRFRLIFPWIIILSVLLFFYYKKTTNEFNKLVQYLNILLVLFIAIEFLQYISILQKVNKHKYVIVKKEVHVAKPNIFLIITDGYAGSQQLKELFNFDNKLFLDSLKSLGFFVAQNSQSNFSGTSSSMATLLGMKYIDASEFDDVNVLFNNNNVIKILQDFKYSIINNSIFKIADQQPHQPISYFPIGITLITRHHFISHLNEVLHNILYKFQFPYEVSRMNKIEHVQQENAYIRDSITYKRLANFIENNDQSSTFIYSHFLMPHAPYLYNRTGERISHSNTSKDNYIEFLQYTNRKLLDISKSILHKSPMSIILLLSDHGYREDGTNEPTPLRFSNLTAVYYPDKNYKKLNNNVSNVNLFRLLFNSKFGQSFSLLPDSTVY